MLHYEQFRVANSPDWHVFVLWEEAGVHGGDKHTDRWRTCKLHMLTMHVALKMVLFQLSVHPLRAFYCYATSYMFLF